MDDLSEKEKVTSNTSSPTTYPSDLLPPSTTVNTTAVNNLSNSLSPLAIAPQLPAECLQIIISQYDGDLTMLHSLLLVNTTCFHIAIRFLYRSPFKLLKFYDGDKLPYNKYMRQVKLVWLLLSCVMHNQWVVDELPPMDQSLPIFRNPIRHNLNKKSCKEKEKENHGNWGRNSNPIRDLTIDYLQFYTHHDHATLSDAFPELFPGFIRQLSDEWTPSTDMTQLRQTIERAFLLHQPESILSLSIPISRMKIYLEAVSRLPRLEYVEFYDIRNWDNSNVEDAITFVKEHDRLATQSQLKFKLQDNPTAQKVRHLHLSQQQTHQQHQQYQQYQQHQQQQQQQQQSTNLDVHLSVHDPDEFGKKMAKLTEIKLGGSGDSNGVIQTPELYKILQAMQHPRMIDLTEWKGAITDIMQIPVQSLQVLRMRLDRPLPVTCPLGSFLLQARSLKELYITIAPTHGRLFRWAVKSIQTRRQRDRSGRKSVDSCRGSISELQEINNGTSTTPTTILSDANQNEGFGNTSNEIKPLQHAGEVEEEEEEGLRVLSLAGETETVVQALNAAAWGFNNTLVSLHANTWNESAELQQENGAAGVPQVPEAPELAQDENEDTAAGGDGSSSSDDSTGASSDGAIGPSLSRRCFSFYPKLPMTRLHTIELKGEVATLALNFQSLKYCPQLVKLRLNTRPCRVEPETDAIDKILANVSSSLLELELIGPWNVADYHLDLISKSLVRLRELRLGNIPLFYSIVPMSSSVYSLQRSDSLSCKGLVHTVSQLGELRGLWLGVDKDLYRRQRLRNSRSIIPFFSKGTSEKEDVWATLADTIKLQSSRRIIPLSIDIQHCPT